MIPSAVICALTVTTGLVGIFDAYLLAYAMATGH